MVRYADAAALNALLVRRRRPRRDARSGATHPGGRRPRGDRGGLGPGGALMIAVELREDAAEPADLGDDRASSTLLPSLVAVLLAVTDLGPRPGTGPAFLSAVLADGALFPLAAIAIILPLFLPAAVAITAGETIAGEAQQGTLRYVLIRPVGRTRLLVAKLVAVMALRAGHAARGRGDGVRPRRRCSWATRPSTVTTTFSGTSLTTPELIERTGLALAYALLSMLGVAAVALFLSTTVRSPLAAAMGTLALLIGSSLLLTLDAARRAAALPRHPLLAVVRRPLPRPDPVARRRARGDPAGRLRRGLPRRRLGQLRHQGHHRLTARRPQPVVGVGGGADRGRRDRRRGTPQLGQHHRHHGRVGRQLAVGDLAAGADRLDGEVERARRATRSPAGWRPGRRWSRSRPSAGPAGVSSPELSERTRSLSVTSWRQAAGHESGARSEASEARSVPCWGEPRVTIRRATDPPSYARSQRRAVTPPAE